MANDLRIIQTMFMIIWNLHDGNFPRGDIGKRRKMRSIRSHGIERNIFRLQGPMKTIRICLMMFMQSITIKCKSRHWSFLKGTMMFQYTNVLIDEFQDTDPVQMAIFERLMDNIKSKTDEVTSFTVVGDINQRIYAFRGSTKDYFKYLRENYRDDFEFMSLATNYRSTNEIIDISEDFIKHQRDEKSSLQKAQIW